MIQDLQVFIVAVNYDDYLRITLPRNSRWLPDNAKINIVTNSKKSREAAIAKESGARVIVSDRAIGPGGSVAKGKAINDALDTISPKDWILILDADILLTEHAIGKITKLDLDKDCLFYTRRWKMKSGEDISRVVHEYDNRKDVLPLAIKYGYLESHDTEPWGYFQLFNKNADSLKGRARIYEERRTSAEMDDSIFGNFVFSSDKRLCLPILSHSVLHLYHGERENWHGRVTPRIPEV